MTGKKRDGEGVSLLSWDKYGKYHTMDVSCAILAGGRSRRMGRDKATLTVCNKSLIQQVYEKAHHVFRDVFIVTSQHEGFADIEAPIVRDVFPIQSSIVGITSALLFADTPYVFVLACDMPFVTPQSIEHVIGAIHGEDIIVPRTQSGLEPLHAVYNRSCISVMLTCIGLQRFKIANLFPFFTVKEIRESPAFEDRGISVFTNITVEEDLSLVQRLGNG